MSAKAEKQLHILFMCVANSARSQLAEGLAKSVFGSAAVIESAGSQPARVNPLAIRAMDEVGLDISSHHSKSVDDLSPRFVAQLDYVITLCAEEVCPIFVSRAKKLHWPHPDPGKAGTEEEKLKSFRDVRDAIGEKLLAFKKELGL
jgi:arsenate reductase